MGKAQSKRSVDITTENKKGAEDEVTEKMEKIEDLDKKEVVNGDANISEKSDPEKKDTEEVENDKDMTTEKENDAQAGGNSVESPNAAETSKEEGGGGSATTEEISPLADESIKKSKKEKVKKKWSFRSISFGKKDKQKPAKTEDGGEDGSETTNGVADTDEKTITDPENCEKNKTVDEKEEKTTENHENGNATPQEIKEGEQHEEKTSDEKSNDITANTTNTTTTETIEPVQNETAAESTELTEKTENAVNPPTPIINENKTTENITTDDATNNGNGVDEKNITTEQKSEQNEVTNESAEASSDKTSSDATNESSPATNGEVLDQIHQNGDHGESEQEVVEKSKELNEVNSNTDNTVCAATLDIISSTSINPSNIQIHVQDLNASSEKLDENVQIDNNKTDVHTSDDIEVKTSHTDAQSSNCEAADSMTENFTNNVQIETDENIGLETNSGNEKSTEDKFGVEPYPPPLPISPPPSQVSVFAFTNIESVGDSFETKNFEETINNTINVEDEEVISPPSAPLCELSKEETTNSNNKLYEENINDLPVQVAQANNELENNVENECGENKDDAVTPQILVDEIKENIETECNVIKDDAALIQHVEVINENVKDVCDEIQEYSKELPINESNMQTTFEDSDNHDETSVVVATELINEITEKAAEIVNDQLKCNEEQIATDDTSDINKHSQEENIKDEVNESTVVEPDNKNENDKQEHVSGITSSSTENCSLIEQINNIATDCSLDFSTSNSKLEDQMISLNKSDNLDEEQLNPTKEFANATDIKENVTVAEITQDLSVTCE